jgi:hypothetical protein
MSRPLVSGRGRVSATRMTESSRDTPEPHGDTPTVRRNVRHTGSPAPTHTGKPRPGHFSSTPHHREGPTLAPISRGVRAKVGPSRVCEAAQRHNHALRSRPSTADSRIVTTARWIATFRRSSQSGPRFRPQLRSAGPIAPAGAAYPRHIEDICADAPSQRPDTPTIPACVPRLPQATNGTDPSGHGGGRNSGTRPRRRVPRWPHAHGWPRPRHPLSPSALPPLRCACTSAVGRLAQRCRWGEFSCQESGLLE